MTEREPLLITLGVENTHLLATLLGWFEEGDDEAGPFRVLGRPCTVVGLCGSVRELQAAAARSASDVLIVSSLLHAIPFSELRALADASGGRLVVLAADHQDARWDAFPAPVLEAEPGRAALLKSLERAASGRAAERSPRRPRSVVSSGSQEASAPMPSPEAVDASGGRVVAIASAASEGASTVATALSFATGMLARTVVLDGNWQGSALEYHFGADPLRNVCLLAHREPKTDAEWTDALRSELQPVGPPSRTQLLCGVARASLRGWLSPEFLDRLLVQLRQRYQFVFVDTSGSGWAPDDPALDRQLLAAADQILLVVRADEQGVSRAARALHGWPHRERISVVLNLASRPGSEQPREVEQVLGVPVVAVVPADFARVAAARARHRPIVRQPGCRASRPLLDLTKRLIGGGPLPVPVDQPPGGKRGWRRLAAPVIGLFE
jgi:Mrp family chromosome partitioning ATPase